MRNRRWLTPYEVERIERIDTVIKAMLTPSWEVQKRVNELRKERRRITLRANNRAHRFHHNVELLQNAAEILKPDAEVICANCGEPGHLACNRRVR